MEIIKGITLTPVLLTILLLGAIASNASTIPVMGLSRNFVPHTNSQVVYVNAASEATTPDGKSWTNAYQSLAEALRSDLTNKKEIWVAKGIYYPTDGTNRNASFTLTAGIALYGGFNGYESDRRQRNFKKNTTILSGEIGDQTDMTDNVYHVVTGADKAILDGFTIQDGYAVLAEGEEDNSGSLVTVPDNIADSEILRIVTNIQSQSGAGLLNIYAGTITKNCVFQNNYASKGGAVYNMVTKSWNPENMDETVKGDYPTFENCVFEGNHAFERGGAVNNDFFTSATFINCRFTENSCAAKGGAVYANMGSPIYFINALFNDNEAERGAALVAEGGSSHRLTYATFIGNTAYDIGAALYQGTYMEIQTIDGEPFSGNEVHLYKSIIAGNESASSSTSISNWHDSLVLFDDDSVVESEDGTLNTGEYVHLDTLMSKAVEYGWHPSRHIDLEYWQDNFNTDTNRTYTAYTYDTTRLQGEERIIYVKTDATGLNDGSSWKNGFNSLSDALLNATDGSEIWVAEGTYTPTTGNDRSASFVMKEGVTILGGFSGNETDSSERDYQEYPTILSGDIGIKGDISDNSYHVVFGASNAVLDGFFIQDGNADGDFHHSRGGGLLCYNSASPEISNCTLRNNTALEGGAIAAVAYSAPAIINCTITGNSAWIGGAMLFRTGPDSLENGAKVVNAAITGNSASDRGGAIYIDYGAWPGFVNSTISGNTSAGNGGAVYVDNNASQLSKTETWFTACSLDGNSTSQRGGAFSIYEGTVFLLASIITDNFALEGAGGIALDYQGNFVNIDDSSTITYNTSLSGENDIDDESLQMKLVLIEDQE